MKPEIFMDDFNRTNSGDLLFSSIGRALTIATRFENNCKMLALILQLKGEVSFSNEHIFNEFIDKLLRNNLFQNIKFITKNSCSYEEILTKARFARNEIVHKLTIGLDSNICDLNLSNLEKIKNNIKDLIDYIAFGDLLTSYFLTIVTNELFPTPKFISTYRKNILHWVIN